MSFSVLKFHHNTLTRIVHEAVKIGLEGNLNSRDEWRFNQRPKLEIEKSDWVAKKLHAEKIVCEKLEVSRIKSVVSRIKTKKTRVEKV